MSTWAALAQQAVTPFTTRAIEFLALATQELKNAEKDFALFTKCYRKLNEEWTGTDVATGSIVVDSVYINAGYTSVTYNSVVYTSGQTFTGVTGFAVYTTAGSGKVIAQTEDIRTTALPSDYSEIINRPAWKGSPLYDYELSVNRNLYDGDGNYYYSTAEYYYIEGEYIYFVAGSSTNGRLDYHYIAIPTSDQSSPQIPARYHDYLVAKAQSILYGQPGIDNTRMRDEKISDYERMKNKIRGQYANSTRPRTGRLMTTNSPKVRLERLG